MTITGLFGGSFNPIHLGHINVAQKVLTEKLVDEVWMLVSPLNPFKENVRQTDEHVRLEWVKKSVADLPHIEASDFEFTMPQPNYTWRTLQALRKAYPTHTFKLIIGGDNWQEFKRWKCYRKILATTPIIIYPRPGYPVDGTCLPEGVCLLDTPQFDISATVIREQIRQGNDVGEWVPEAIAHDLQLLK